MAPNSAQSLVASCSRQWPKSSRSPIVSSTLSVGHCQRRRVIPCHPAEVLTSNPNDQHHVCSPQARTRVRWIGPDGRFFLTMAKLTRRPPRASRKRISARAPKIMHPHAYADSTHVSPSVVDLQSEALESMPKPVPQHVLEAGKYAARRRRLPLAYRLTEATVVVQSTTDLHHHHHGDYRGALQAASMTSISPASTVVERDHTRSGSVTPDRETSRSWIRHSSRRKPHNPIDVPAHQMSFYRRFVLLWKRVTRIVRKFARLGSESDRSTHPQSWPTGFIAVEPWWKRHAVSSQTSRRSSLSRYSSLFGRHVPAQN